jgi:modulator of FtsH protease HflC
MRNKLPVIIAIAIVAVIFIVNLFVYTVAETEQVIITKFGQYKRTVPDAGLHLKLPVIEQVNTFEKRLLEWDGKPTQVPTQDKRYIWVDSFARWRIEDPLKFFKTVKDENSAHSRLDDIVNGTVRNQITNNPLIRAIRSSDREMQTDVGVDEERVGNISKIGTGRDGIVAKILAEARPAAKELGIEIVDIRIKRINYVEEVRRAAYERMIAERKRIAAKFRSEGEGEMMRIEGQKEEEEKKIISEGYRQAQEIMGKADAEAINIYAKAYSKDPEFYSFLKTLESYEKNLGKRSTVILSTDSEYLQYLKNPAKP